MEKKEKQTKRSFLEQYTINAKKVLAILEDEKETKERDDENGDGRENN